MCPNHQISEQLLIQYFCEGLMMMDRNMIDVAGGGALMDKMSARMRHLISNMVSNMQQFATRGAVTNRVMNEVSAIDNLRLENQLTELTSLVRQLAVGQHQQIPPVKICGICTSVEHPTYMCPTLQETESNNAEIVGAIGGNQYGRQPYQTRQFDGRSSTDRVRVKGNMQSQDLDLRQTCRLRITIIISSWDRDIQCHYSNNSNNKCRHKTTRHPWRNE
ncbi:hypothetical protein CR513_18741, partial [Mucuna pruriens]